MGTGAGHDASCPRRIASDEIRSSTAEASLTMKARRRGRLVKTTAGKEDSSHLPDAWPESTVITCSSLPRG